MGFEIVAGMLTLASLKDDYSVFSPVAGLGGRNGGLGLKSRWRALWAMGVKTVILKSTLWWFWSFRSLCGLVAYCGRSALLYICNDIVAGVLPYIRMAGDALRVSCPLAGLLAVGLARGLVLF